eukprot:Skav225630  [mRNA]  locus=scaffold1513:131209:135099:- [translate_table: standard]
MLAGCLGSALPACDDSYKAELSAALVACKFAFDLCKLQLHARQQTPQIHFVFDALTVGNQMMGLWQATQQPRQVALLRGIWLLCETAFRTSMTGEHTHSHRGDPGNELVDSLALMASKQQFDTSLSTWYDLIALPSFVDSAAWFWMLFDDSFRDNFADGYLRIPAVADTSPTFSVLPAALSEVEPEPAQCLCTLQLRVCSANVLTLKAGPSLGEGDIGATAGPARQESILRQLFEEDITVFGLQETRQRRATTGRDDRFLLISSPATEQGHHGLLLGLNRKVPLGHYMNDNEERIPVYFDDSCYAVGPLQAEVPSKWSPPAVTPPPTMDVHTHAAKLERAILKSLRFAQLQQPRLPVPLRKTMTQYTWKLVQEKRTVRHELAVMERAARAVYEQMLGVAASGSGAAQIYERMLGKPLGQPSTPCAKQESEDESAIAVSSSGASGDEAAASSALPIAASMPRGCWYDPSRKAMVRSAHNSPGELEVASMAAGPNGFCVGKFDNGQEFETEVPNMMIVAPAPSKVMKRPGAAPKMGALKRPAAAQVGARKKPAAALQAPVAHPTAPASSANSASPAAPASSGAAPIEENPVFWLSTTNFFC